MPFGGGAPPAPFNGGTITRPLVIDYSGGSGNDVPLKILASYNAQNVDFFRVTSSDDNTDLMLLDASAVLSIAYPTSAHAGRVIISGSGGGANAGEIRLRDTLGATKTQLEAVGLLTRAIASGALPTVALVSGAGAQLLTTRDVDSVTPFTGDGTNNVASCLVEISPDNVTYSTLETLSIAAALNLTGVLTVGANVHVPAGWYLKLTATHGTIDTTTYY